MKNTLFISVVIALMALPGCQKDRPFFGGFFDRDNKAKPIIEEVQSDIEDIHANIGDATSSIDDEATSINTEADKITDPAYSEETGNIKDSAGKILAANESIKKNNDTLAQDNIKLDDAVNDVEKMEDFAKKSDDARVQAEEERDKAIAKANDATRNMLRWLIACCIIGVGASVAMMVFGNFKTGSIILVGCGTVLVLAVAVDKYLVYIAIAGLVLLAACVGFLIYQIILRNKAVDEVIHTTEIAKTKLLPEDRKKIFGYREEPGMAYTIQSKSTEDLVEKARKRFKKSWEPTVPATSMEDALKTKPTE